MIRPIRPEDTANLIALTAETGMFKPMELDTLDDVLDDYHTTNEAFGHRCVALEEDGELRGYAYYAPATMTDRSWYLYWIAVSLKSQAKGVGRRLMASVEEDIRQQAGRLLFIETSSLPNYEPTRQFYLRIGYQIIATLTDFYSDGDSMVIFSKRLSPVTVIV